MNTLWRPLPQDSVEFHVWPKLIDSRARVSQLEQFLGRDHDQRLSETTSHLSPEDMEVVGSCRAVDDLPVEVLEILLMIVTLNGRDVVWIIVTHLQIALNPG